MFLCNQSTSAQTTYYYKQTKVVKNNVTSTKVSGGQFITFTSKSCYESDKEGFSVNNGVLKYNDTYNGIKTYRGDSYWGKAMFRFKEDLSKLNVVVESDNSIYVYERATPPNNVLTCSLIKPKEQPKEERPSSSNNGGNSSIVYVPVPVIGNSYYGYSNSSSTTTTTAPPKQVRTCHWCNGTGRVLHENYGGINYGLERSWKKCDECGKTYDSSLHTHYHSTCSHCNGSGVLQ